MPQSVGSFCLAEYCILSVSAQLVFSCTYISTVHIRSPLENLLPKTSSYCKREWHHAKTWVSAGTGDHRVLFLSSNLLDFRAHGLWEDTELSALGGC